MATAEQDVVFQTTTRDELSAELDMLAQESLDLSGEDFIQRWTAGDLDQDDPTVARLAVFARLLRV